MLRVYLDSNVFISLLDREIGRHIRGLFVEAELFLEKAKKQRAVLALSGLFFKEVEKHCYLNEQEVQEYFERIGIKTEKIETKEKLSLKEFLSEGMHFADALHAAIAIKNKCDCIVTFNTKDFQKIKNKIRIVEPADFT